MLHFMTGETLSIKRLDSWVARLTVTKLESVNKTIEINILITLDDLKGEIARAEKIEPCDSEEGP